MHAILGIGSEWLSPLDEAFARLLLGERALIASLLVAAILLLFAWRTVRKVQHHRIVESLRALGDAKITNSALLKVGAPAWVEVEASGGPRLAKATVAGSTRKHVTLRLDDGETADGLRAGAPLHVELAEGGALLRFSGPLVDRRTHALGVELYLPRPRALLRVQRRDNFRVGVLMPATLVPYEAAGGSLVRGTIDSLSGGGFRVLMADTVPPGTVIEARFPTLECGISRFTARIVHVAQLHPGGDYLFAARCEFVHIDEETQNRLINYCFGLQIAERRADMGSG